MKWPVHRYQTKHLPFRFYSFTTSTTPASSKPPPQSFFPSTCPVLPLSPDCSVPSFPFDPNVNTLRILPQCVVIYCVRDRHILFLLKFPRRVGCLNFITQHISTHSDYTDLASTVASSPSPPIFPHLIPSHHTPPILSIPSRHTFHLHIPLPRSISQTRITLFSYHLAISVSISLSIAQECLKVDKEACILTNT